MAKSNDDLSKKNVVLAKRLRDNGLDDSILINENVHDVAAVIKRAQVYQGKNRRVSKQLIVHASKKDRQNDT